MDLPGGASGIRSRETRVKARPKPGGWAHLLIVLLGTGLANPVPTEAQGLLRDALMEVDLPREPGPVPVRVTYRLLQDTLADGVPLTLLSPSPTRVRGKALEREFFFGGFPDFLQVRPHFSTAEVPFVSTLTLEYSVEGAWSGNNRVTLPIPAPGWVPERPLPRTFVARVTAPAGWTVLESFPTSVTQRPPDAGGGVYEVALQGVPSMLILRLSRGPAPVLTLERLLDILVVAGLFLMAVLGLRHLKGARA